MREAVLGELMAFVGLVATAVGFISPLLVLTSISYYGPVSAAYLSAAYQPAGGMMAFVDSITGAPFRPDLYVYRFMYAIIGLTLLFAGLAVWVKVRD